jgi:hypothetical protein
MPASALQPYLKGSSLKIAQGQDNVVGSLVVKTGLANVQSAFATFNEPPGAGAGDGFLVSVDVGAGGLITIRCWQDDATVATEEITLSWIAFGT